MQDSIISDHEDLSEGVEPTEKEGGPRARLEAFMSTRRRKQGTQVTSRRQQLRVFRTLQALHRPSLSQTRPQAQAKKGAPIIPAGENVNPQNQPDEPVGLLLEPVGPAQSLLAAHWYPLGPAPLRRGQAGGRPPVSGRVTSLALGPSGQLVFAGSANGGVWRSNNAGLSWQPLMNGLHYMPVHQTSDSLAIGAVVLDRQNPCRVFAGSGEGPGSSVTRGAPEFFGIGPLFSRDGGFSWENETVSAYDVAIQGSAFYQMAMDPRNPERVVGATRDGLIVRRPRNHTIADGRKTCAYFWQATGSRMQTFYWDKGGTLYTPAWHGNGLKQQAVIAQTFLRGLPYFVYYKPLSGFFELRLWQGEGNWVSLNRSAGPSTWGLRLMLMPFTLSNRLFVVRYSPISGLASLAEFVITGSAYIVEDVWTDLQWGSGWTSLIPMTLEGQPYFIAYNAITGHSTLQRWNVNGTPSRVWLKQWLDGLALMPFNIGQISYILSVASNTGSATVQRVYTDGRLETVSNLPADTFPHRPLQLCAFDFEDGVRFLAYDKLSGDALLFYVNGTASAEQIWWKRWPTGLSLGTFPMGYEWQAPTLNPNPVVNRATSVVTAQKGNSTYFFSAFANGNVYTSEDGGLNWRILGNGFPPNAGRITLAVKADNPDVAYAFVENGRVFRFQRGSKWYPISGVPPESILLSGQGYYDLAIAVSPANIDTLYLGGASNKSANDSTGAAIYRCEITHSIIFNPSMTATLIGESVHADIHAFAFVEGDPDRLWVGCDGGVFATDRARDTQDLTNLFKARNCGLSTLTVNAVGQHPFEDAILYCGSQDNGGAYMRGGDGWQLGSFGDGGAVLTWWESTNTAYGHVIYNYIQDQIRLSDTGDEATYADTVAEGAHTAQKALMYPPYCQFPEMAIGPNYPRIGYGGMQPWINDDYGAPPKRWHPIGPVLGATQDFAISSMIFASRDKFYVGLINGQLYRYTFVAPAWTAPVRLDNQGTGIQVQGPITGIGIDPSNDDLIYVCIGGAVNDYRKVWHYNGANWEARSGPGAGSANSLLPIQYNTLVVSLLGNAGANPPLHLFLGGDLGVWHSWDGGHHWQTLSEALPESAIFDLKLYPADPVLQRPWLIRAATDGRSVYERVLKDANPVLASSLALPVQLYLCPSNLDRGLYPAKTRLNQLANGEADIRCSIDLKILKSTNGTFVEPAVVDACEYARIVDQSMTAIMPILGRVYVRVHNRGYAVATRVKLRLMLTKASPQPLDLANAPAIPQLPSNFVNAVNLDKLFESPKWTDLGSQFAEGLSPEVPLVVSTDFPLLERGSYYLLAALSDTLDPMTAQPPNNDTLEWVKLNRKVAIRYFKVG